MKKILILGANGQIARFAIDLFLEQPDVRLRLYLRNAKRLRHRESDRVEVIEGDVLDQAALTAAMVGQDAVYANLDGQLERQAHAIVKAMHANGLKRLVFVSSMGIYGEVPGETYGSVLDPYRKSAAIIEASDLDYTIVRPAWLDNEDEIDYGTTRKGESFKGSAVSRKSVADLIVKLTTSQRQDVRESLGIARI